MQAAEAAMLAPESRESMTRSGMRAARKAETVHQLQSQYDEWASRNPRWAPRLTGMDSAVALGYAKDARA